MTNATGGHVEVRIFIYIHASEIVSCLLVKSERNVDNTAALEALHTRLNS